VPGFRGLSSDKQAEHVVAQFLQTDLSSIGSGSLPPLSTVQDGEILRGR